MYGAADAPEAIEIERETLACAYVVVKPSGNEDNGGGHDSPMPVEANEGFLSEFEARLPFKFTRSQKDACTAVYKDMLSLAAYQKELSLLQKVGSPTTSTKHSFDAEDNDSQWKPMPTETRDAILSEFEVRLPFSFTQGQKKRMHSRFSNRVEHCRL